MQCFIYTNCRLLTLGQFVPYSITKGRDQSPIYLKYASGKQPNSNSNSNRSRSLSPAIKRLQCYSAVMTDVIYMTCSEISSDTLTKGYQLARQTLELGAHQVRQPPNILSSLGYLHVVLAPRLKCPINCRSLIWSSVLSSCRPSTSGRSALHEPVVAAAVEGRPARKV